MAQISEDLFTAIFVQVEPVLKVGAAQFSPAGIIDVICI